MICLQCLQIIALYISAFFEHEWDFLASDGSELCKSGDTVLMRRLEDAAETSESAFLQYLAERQFWKEDDKKKPRAVTFEVSSYLDKLFGEASSTVWLQLEDTVSINWHISFILPCTYSNI